MSRFGSASDARRCLIVERGINEQCNPTGRLQKEIEMIKILRAAALVGLFSAAPAIAAQIDLSTLTYNGTASAISSNELQLTADAGSQAGRPFCQVP